MAKPDQPEGRTGRTRPPITARTIILPVDLDRHFPPTNAEAEARLIPGAECRVLRSDWGHMAPMNQGDWPAIDAALRELLEG